MLFFAKPSIRRSNQIFDFAIKFLIDSLGIRSTTPTNASIDCFIVIDKQLTLSESTSSIALILDLLSNTNAFIDFTYAIS